MSFPEKFTWGAAASAYQTEGAWNSDGKGLSVWDMFTRDGSHIWEGHSGRDACDHYHRYPEDVALLKKIGLQAYRFSVSWPRVLPHGEGRANTKGLDFYDRLVDELLAAGIQLGSPCFTGIIPMNSSCAAAGSTRTAPNGLPATPPRLSNACRTGSPTGSPRATPNVSSAWATAPANMLPA